MSPTARRHILITCAACSLIAMIGAIVPTGAAGASASVSQTWAKRYNGEGKDFDFATSVVVSPDGTRVFVTGISWGSTTLYDYATIAYDTTTGKQLWAKRYNGLGSLSDFADSLAVSPTGTTVFVTGQSPGPSGRDDYATVAYDATTGQRRWVQRYDGPAGRDDDPRGVAVSPDGMRVFVTGGSAGPGTQQDYATIAYGAATGTRLWVKRYDGQGGTFDVAFDIGVTPDGSRVFVTGGSGGSTSFDDYATIAYDASTGAQRWVKRYDGAQHSFDVASSLVVSPSGTRVYVTGGSGGTTSFDYATIAYDASTGSQLWAKRYSGPGKDYDYAESIGVSPDGSRVFVTGTSIGPASNNDYDYATIAYDASSGAQIWAKRYQGEGRAGDFASSLAVSHVGTLVYVTGESWGSSTDFDYATVAYDTTTGAQVWAKRYNGEGDARDDAASVAGSPTGSAVFVTGESLGSTSGYDYATIAYSS